MREAATDPGAMREKGNDNFFVRGGWDYGCWCDSYMNITILESGQKNEQVRLEDRRQAYRENGGCQRSSGGCGALVWTPRRVFKDERHRTLLDNEDEDYGNMTSTFSLKRPWWVETTTGTA